MHVVLPNKLQQESGGTVAKGGKGAKPKSLFLVLFSSKSLFQSHFKSIFLGEANFSRWGWKTFIGGANCFGGCTPLPENLSMV